MRVYTVERTVVTKIRQEITAHSKGEALKIADEVVSFSMIGADDYTTKDRVIDTRELVDGTIQPSMSEHEDNLLWITRSDPDYLGNCARCTCSFCHNTEKSHRIDEG